MIPRKGLRPASADERHAPKLFRHLVPDETGGPVTKTLSMDLFLLCSFGYDSNHPDWNSPVPIDLYGKVK